MPETRLRDSCTLEVRLPPLADLPVVSGRHEPMEIPVFTHALLSLKVLLQFLPSGALPPTPKARLRPSVTFNARHGRTRSRSVLVAEHGLFGLQASISLLVADPSGTGDVVVSSHSARCPPSGTARATRCASRHVLPQATARASAGLAFRHQGRRSRRRLYAKISPRRWIELNTRSCGSPGH